MQKTVFISSTYQDLALHRRAVWSLLEEFDVSVRGMEEFGARKEAPLDTCIAEVEQSDIYVGIIAFRLGSVEQSTGKSFTQLEYERASELDRDILIYLIDEDNAEVKAKYIDRDGKREKLEAFKRTLRERHTIDTFVSKDDLTDKLRRDLSRRLEPEAESRIIPDDDYKKAESIITQFLLVPKAFSGKEVGIEVIVKGNLFPASREICAAFNLEFGATVGLSVKIVKPEGFQDGGLDHLFLNARQLGDFTPIRQGERRLLYAKLQFADSKVESIRTRFKSESYYAESAFLNALSSTSGILGERVHLEAEGKVILVLTENVKRLIESEEVDNEGST